MWTRHGRWILCGLLFLATTLNYLDRQTLSILAPTIQRELALDNESLGWLFSVFYYSYTFAQFGIGPLLDRVNLRWAYGLGVLAWSTVAAATSFATSFGSLIAFRLLLGIAESINWPAAMRVVARALPPEERSLGNGIFTSGTSVGALIAPTLILGIAAASGWRWSFVVVGALGAAWFVIWIWCTRDSRWEPIWRVQVSGKDGTSAGVAADYRSLLGLPQFWRVLLVSTLVNPCLYFQVNWLPAYLAQERGINANNGLGAILTWIYLGLDLGYLASGAGVLLLARRLPLGASRRIVFGIATVFLALCGLAPLVRETSTAIALLVAANFGAGAWIAMYLTMAQEVSPTRVSTAAGLLGGSGSLAGAFAMWAVGRASQQSGSFLGPMLGVTAAAVLAALAGIAVTRTRQGFRSPSAGEAE
jgi:MFS transporter, ACS family, hexuronate transporter